MKKYYHGTSYYSAYRIFKEGFRCLRYYGMQGVKGQGIYVTDNTSYAFEMAASKVNFSSDSKNKICIIECDLNLSNPIFWTDKQYDIKVIAYLRKEFSKKIEDPNYDINKIIPNNKQLTKNEVINLVNFWSVQESKKKDKKNKKGMNSYFKEKPKGDSTYVKNSRFLLSRHGYSAWGQYTHDCWDSDEICIFNPSEAVPKKCFNAEGQYNKDSWLADSVKLGSEVSETDLLNGFEAYVQEVKQDDIKWQENMSNDLYK